MVWVLGFGPGVLGSGLRVRVFTDSGLSGPLSPKQSLGFIGLMTIPSREESRGLDP